MNDRTARAQLLVSSEILGQLVTLNTMVSLTNAGALPDEVRAAVLAASRRARRAIRQVRDALADDAPEPWQRDALDD